ncbi:thioesterase II family protein (plasmid) [Streptomyces sp. CG1]|uniref:thioesterase II family protein n=1 Tax=Streptomyces sp. CG1 TaxID=1287523 RepID=UPI0034E1ADD3
MTARADPWARWFPGPPVPAEAETILFCLPNAGGGAAPYLAWQRLLPPRLWAQPVQLPGRENRIGEPSAFDAGELAEGLARRADRPFALYGHSMGGVLACEAARVLLARGAPAPRRLYLGASHPPHLPCEWVRRWRALPDDALLAEVARLGGIPREVLGHGVIRRRLTTVLRSDLDWLAARPTTVPAPLPVPVVAVAGSDDPLAGPSVMPHWAPVTSAGLTVHTVRGGHLFHTEDPGALVALILADLLVGPTGPTRTSPEGDRHGADARG